MLTCKLNLDEMSVSEAIQAIERESRRRPDLMVIGSNAFSAMEWEIFELKLNAYGYQIKYDHDLALPVVEAVK